MNKLDDIETLYYTYSDDVYRYLLSMCQNKNTAEDIMQSTFLYVIKGLAKFRNDCTIKTWIFTIARNEYFRYMKKNKDFLLLDDSFIENLSVNNVEDECINREKVKKIFEYLNKLDELHRSLMILRLSNDFSFKEIAIILNKTEVWARVNFMRNKCKMLQELKEEIL